MYGKQDLLGTACNNSSFATSSKIKLNPPADPLSFIDINALDFPIRFL